MLKLNMPREEKMMLIEQLQHFLEDDQDLQVGQLASERILDEFMKLIGPAIYNQAIADTRRMINDRMQSIEDELYSMEKR